MRGATFKLTPRRLFEDFSADTFFVVYRMGVHSAGSRNPVTRGRTSATEWLYMVNMLRLLD